MIADFCEVGEQPPDPVKFTARLSELHKKSSHLRASSGITRRLAMAQSPNLPTYRKTLGPGNVIQEAIAYIFAIDFKKHGP